MYCENIFYPQSQSGQASRYQGKLGEDGLRADRHNIIEDNWEVRRNACSLESGVWRTTDSTIMISTYILLYVDSFSHAFGSNL